MKRALLLLAAFACGWGLSELAYGQQELPREPAPVAVAPGARAADDNAEILTRGPVHEAFAQAVTPATEAGLIVKKEPPQLIDEIPPAQRPSGTDIAWIPGYWGWDDERNDYIWISGIWRAVPPGREWVPGYWTTATGGFQWVSGYWADVNVAEVEYLPEPPEIVDAGPSTQSPTGSEIWVPGTWVWQQNKYAWRAGYWAKGDPRWVWTNSHYVYTPRGYIYIKGYWDFVPEQRGVLFAPVYFSGPVQANYVYSPRLVVNTAVLLDHLFLRPTYRHYYYGDYYAAPYRGRGILPYFVFNNSRYGYDSLYSYNRWKHRDDRNWERGVEARYDDLRDREAGRPPRDYASWEKRTNRDTDRNPYFTGIQDYSRTSGSSWKFRDLGDDARKDVGRMSRDLDTYRQQRIKAEAQATVRTNDAGREPDRVRALKPPIGDAPRSGVGRGDRDDNDLDRNPLDRNPAVRNPLDRPRTKPSDGSIEPREAPRNPRDLPGPLNDIRTPREPGRPDPTDRPKPNRDNPGPLNETRDIPKDRPKTAPRVDRDDERPKTPAPNREVPKAEPRDRTPETPKVTPKVNPRETPKTAPQPREVPKAAPQPRETPKAAPQPPPREAPKAAPRPQPAPQPTPQPAPRVERPERPAPGGGGRPQGGGNPDRGKKN